MSEMTGDNPGRWFQDRLQKARKENYWIIIDTQEPDGETDEP